MESIKNRIVSIKSLNLAECSWSAPYAFLVCLPALLPNFYSWKTCFGDENNPILIALWLVGVFCKYLSFLLAATHFILNRSHLRKTYFFKTSLYFAGFFLVIIVSSLIAGRGIQCLYDIWNQFLNMAPMALYLTSLGTKRISETEGRDALFLKLIFAAALIVSLLTLLFYLIFPEGFGLLFAEAHTWRGDRKEGTFIGMHTDVALYALNFLAIAVLLNEKAISESHRRLFFVVCLVVNALLLYYSTSAAAMLSLIMELLLIALGYLFRDAIFRKEIKVSNLHRAMLVIAFAVSVITPQMLSEGSVIKNILESLDRDVTLTGRLPMYITAITLFCQSPLLGVGFSEDFFNTVFINSFGEHKPVPHNSFLQILVEGGLLAAVCYFQFFSLYMNGNKGRAKMAAFSDIVLESVLVCAIFVSATLVDLFTLPFALLLGLIGWHFQSACLAQAIHEGEGE